MKVYLAGPIFGKSDGECNDWRSRAKELLAGHETADPMARDYRGREDECYAEIVEGDKADIAECDAILAFCESPSWGTAMELHYAWQASKRVISVVPSGRISPWLRYHTTPVRSIEEAVAAITA